MALSLWPAAALPPFGAASPNWPGWPSGYRPGFFTATGRVSPLDHHLDAALIEQTAALVEMTSVCERCTDFAQAHALAGLGACPVKPLGQRYRAWPLLGMALAPFAF